MKNEYLRAVICGVLTTVIIATVGFSLGISTKLPGPESEDSLMSNQGELIATSKGIAAKDSFVATLGHDQISVGDPRFVEVRESLISFLREQTDLSNEKLFSNFKTLGHSWSQEDQFVSKDSRHLLLIAQSNLPVYQTAEQIKSLPEKLSQWASAYPDFKLSYTSSGIVANELFNLINTDLDQSLTFTIPITVIILLWAFRSLASAVVAISLTGLCLICSLGFCALFSHTIGPISATAAQLVVLLVMAVGTDYSLFFISRVRKEVRRGYSYREAVLMCEKSTGKAIFWSGITVAVSLLGLLLATDPILTSMALVSIFAIIITLFFTLKVLPSFLNIIGSKLEWGNLRAINAERLPQNKPQKKSWILWSTRNPKTAVLLSSSILLSLGFFCFSMKLGSTMHPAALPQQMQSSVTTSLINNHFPELAGTDLSLIFHSANLSQQEEGGDLQDFLDRLHSQEQVRGPLTVEWSVDRSTSRYKYTVEGSSQDQGNKDLIKRIKDDLIPTLLHSKKIEGYVSGKLVYDVEQEDKHRDRIFAVIASILLVSLLFLSIAFESIVIPIKALILNILSSAASFGLLVLVFQHYGWKYGVIESFVPSLLFSILFGLSMDYHLFLLSSIQEEVKNGLSTRKAVEVAITNTYGIISSAATIMASVFIVISFLELPLMKQLGLGLAFAVVLDATLIRCVLLPASMILLGDLNWYMPASIKSLVRRLKGA